jgi:tricorn protease
MLAGAMLATLLTSQIVHAGQTGLPRFPSISPDGSEIVVSWGGDLWRVPSVGGQAVRLTRHPLDDLHSSWSPDGEWIIFSSMRDGYLNLWRIHRDGSRLTQITHGDRHIRYPAYGLNENGQPVITFSGLLEGDVYRDQRPYAVSPKGGEPRRLHDAFGSAPRLSPDGRRVAFTRGGYYHGWSRRHYRGPDAMNVWVYDLREGGFEALTTRDGDDGNAQWIDGQTLVFMSDRERDTVNLYRVDLDDEERRFRRLTAFDGRDVQHFDVSRNGGTAVLHVWDTIYTLDLTDPDAEPRPVHMHVGDEGYDDYELRRIDRDVTEAALSPDGRTMAYIAYGRVYVRHMDRHSATRAVTPGTHARHKDLAWSPDGVSLYFTNDSDGAESIYEARVALTRSEIRRTYDRHAGGEPVRAQEPQATAPAPSDRPEEPGAPAEPDQAAEPEPAPPTLDPEDPFAPVDPGIPDDPLAEPEPGVPSDPAALPEPMQELPDLPESIPEGDLEPPSVEDLPLELDPARWHDAVLFTVRAVVQTDHNDREAVPSPDGRFLAFRRGRGDLIIRALESGDERRLVQGWDSRIHWRWSPDGRYIAYSQNDLNFSANIFIVPVDGSREPVNITRHPRDDINPRWSADGRKLTFISNRSGNAYDLYRVYLDRELENYTARELTGYYRDARSAAGSTVPSGEQAPRDLDLENAWRRVRRVTAQPTHQFGNEMTPGGDRYVFNSGGEGLVVMNWDGSGRRRLGPEVSVQHLDSAGDRVIYISGGRVGMVNLAGEPEHRHLDISDSIRIDLQRQSLQKFREAARVIAEHFYRPDMKGLDWPSVVRDYESLIVRTRTASEFSDIANRLTGELAASHTGVSNPGPASPLREPAGRLGIEHETVLLENGGIGFRITAIVPNGPADSGSMQLRKGDIITEIDLRGFEVRDTLAQRLRGRVGQEVILTVERPVGELRNLYRTLITPVDFGELGRLRYEAFLEESRRTVEALSDGRIGYLHIQAMNQTSLEGFQGDLYAAAEGREGLIIDVRNNGGGSTTDRILTSIMAPDHAYTVPAGADPAQTGHYPQGRLDAPRYTLPVNMLANEKSYSNAEILAHAFRSLGRGTLVGRQTYGGVISSGTYTLIDGATVRRPFRGWYLPDGTDMEHNGAIPNLLVEQTPEDEVAGRDRQLERAVEDLLQRLDGEG